MTVSIETRLDREDETYQHNASSRRVKRSLLVQSILGCRPMSKLDDVEEQTEM